MAETQVFLCEVIGRGMGLVNSDATRRLSALGFKRKGSGKIKQVGLSRMQADYLKGYPQIRDLDHYRELLGEPRSKGPIHIFTRGEKVLVERMEYPKSQKEYYVVLDTAIRGDVSFIEALVKQGTLKLTPITS